MSSRNKSFSPSRILLIKTSSFDLIRSLRVSFSAPTAVAHTGVRLCPKTLPLGSQSTIKVEPCSFPHTSQPNSLLPGKAFAALRCPFAFFVKVPSRHRCPCRSANEQNPVTQQTNSGLRRAPCSRSRLKRGPQMRFPTRERVSGERFYSSAVREKRRAGWGRQTPPWGPQLGVQNLIKKPPVNAHFFLRLPVTFLFLLGNPQYKQTTSIRR